MAVKMKTIVTYRATAACPTHARADLGAVNSKLVTVNQDYWNNLPDKVKEVLQAVAIDYRDHLAGIAMDRAAESEAAYVAAGGTIIDVSPEDRAAWANAMPSIAQEWAATLDENGEDGTGMLAAYLGKLAAAGYVGVRDWTAE